MQVLRTSPTPRQPFPHWLQPLKTHYSLFTPYMLNLPVYNVMSYVVIVHLYQIAFFFSFPNIVVVRLCARVCGAFSQWKLSKATPTKSTHCHFNFHTYHLTGSALLHIAVTYTVLLYLSNCEIWSNGDQILRFGQIYNFFGILEIL